MEELRGKIVEYSNYGMVEWLNDEMVERKSGGMVKCEIARMVDW